ncbi:M20/M25/M40 family metallo-hydrolase [Nesterenkonia sphaerica]|uniref:M20 family metallopeptidase n=1 Tax=Nesterenkonia sphaerica TaxID=1804988 RepID=A0A5R9AQ04_9MICC|nr:M20/M25/M40 family metallo-hydrolase [Nesterenkonia sphaerica]TLP79965.1 M20 family metallopeptidase [Nesterenkonia sphaerica]
MPAISPALLEAAESRLDQIIADIQTLVEVETPSDDKDAVAEGAAVVADLIAARLGLEAEPVVVDDVTHLRLRVGTEKPKVVVVTHQDTVWPTGTLARKPFSNDGHTLRGPGVFDMLTGLAMAIHAAKLLQDSGHSLYGLSIMVTGDEELGSVTSRDLLLEESAEARAAFVMEGALDTSLKIARKGTSNYTVAVHGVAAHAGLDPEKGVNAGISLGLLLPQIAALGDPTVGTTVTPTVMRAGTTTNTVPDYAEVVVDARAATIAEQERVDEQIRALRSEVEAAEVEVTGGVNRPPMERSSSELLFNRAQQVAAALGAGELTGEAVGGASDGNFTAAAGIPTLDGIGACGAGAHAEHEHALVEHIAPRTALLAGLIAAHLDPPAVG